MKTKVETQGAPAATGPYSQAIISGNLVFTSGQVYLKPDGNLLQGTIDDRMRQIMNNLKAVLEAAGVTFADVVKTTIYVTDMSLYGKVNDIYAGYMTEPFPARETVCVKALPAGATVEISMVAVKP